MSVGYKLISWNRQKVIYDLILISLISLYIFGFIFVGLRLDENANLIILRMRALGSIAFLLITLILTIGPLCRLSPRFLPFLYNRRHLGVMTFLIALGHAYYVVIEYHKWGKLEPVFNIFLGNTNYSLLTQFPFQTLGAFALLILFFMALTSHDLWLKKLTPRIWKSLHVLVYIAYASVVLHVVLGPLQFENDPFLIGLILASVVLVLGLHLIAGIREFKKDSETSDTLDGYVRVGRASEIPEGRAQIINVPSERVAVFKHKKEIFAVSNVCTHQNGPLGEGRIINGCVTCPWHGYQFNPKDGKAPAPFEDRVDTYEVKLKDGYIYVSEIPKPVKEGKTSEPKV